MRHPGESGDGARHRVLDLIRNESGCFLLLLQMLHPEGAPLVWRRVTSPWAMATAASPAHQEGHFALPMWRSDYGPRLEYRPLYHGSYAGLHASLSVNIIVEGFDSYSSASPKGFCSRTTLSSFIIFKLCFKRPYKFLGSCIPTTRPLISSRYATLRTRCCGLLNRTSCFICGRTVVGIHMKKIRRPKYFTLWTVFGRNGHH